MSAARDGEEVRLDPDTNLKSHLSTPHSHVRGRSRASDRSGCHDASTLDGMTRGTAGAPCVVRAQFQDPRLYVEEAVLSENELLRLATDCGLDVPPTLLRWYVDNGYLAPTLEIRIADELDAESLIGYSRWQLFALFELERARRGILHIFEDHTAVDEQDRRSWREQLRLRRPMLVCTSEHYQRWLELALLLQNKYVARARGHGNWTVQIRSSVDEAEHNAYLAGEYASRVAGDGPLREVGLTLEQVKSLRQDLGLRIHWLDPLRDEWYRLVRFVRLRQREKLRGTARLAQELYIADRILAEYIQELTGEPQPDAEDLGGSPSDDWPTRIYGRSKDYRDPAFREVLLTQFGLHPTSAAVLFAEGETEEELYPAVGKMLGFSFERFGISIEPLKGVGNAMRVVDLVAYLARPATSGDSRLLRRPLVTPYVVVDREGPARNDRLISEMRKKSLDAYLHVWDRDFERDNFTPAEISDALNTTFGMTTTETELEAWKASHRSLERWFSDVHSLTIRKRDLVPAYLRIIEDDLKRKIWTRPVVTLINRVVGFALRELPPGDPRREGYRIFGH